MNKVLKSKHITAIALAAMLMMTLAPPGAVYAQASEAKKANKFVELATRAGGKVESFIAIIYVNESAIAAIEAVA